VVLTGGDPGSTACAPCQIAQAWKALNGGKYATGCADAMAIALGEGVYPPQPLKYITDYGGTWAGPASPTDNTASGPSISKSDFIVQTSVFNLDQRPYDEQATLGPWQTMTAKTGVTDPIYRVKEVRVLLHVLLSLGQERRATRPPSRYFAILYSIYGAPPPFQISHHPA
jgi:hypothetical protein